MTLRELQVQGTARLAEAGIADSAFEAACLLECATGFTRGQCLCRAAEHMPQSAETQFFAMVARRTSGEPLQYILGKWPFYGRLKCLHTWLLSYYYYLNKSNWGLVRWPSG